MRCTFGFWLSMTTMFQVVLGATLKDEAVRSMATDADIYFIMAILNDLNANFDSYTSYMIQNHLTIPQQLADYYNHLATLPDTADLELDMISTFPFTHFQTFITNFPWYTSLLSEGFITTMYLPEYFVTMNNATTGSSTTTQNTISTTNSSWSSSSTISSQNGAISNNLTIFTPLSIIFMIFGLFL